MRSRQAQQQIIKDSELLGLQISSYDTDPIGIWNNYSDPRPALAIAAMVGDNYLGRVTTTMLAG